jgi:hypothetical protein
MNEKHSKMKKYLYCIDTKQIIQIIEYSIQMMSISINDIQKQSKQQG